MLWGSPAREAPVPTPGRHRILIVEDQPDVRRVIARFVRLLDGEPVLARDGVEGWELARTADPPFDLVITDNHMPRMTGRALILKLRQLSPSIRVLRVTGSDGPEDAPASDGTTTLHKPFTLDEFSAAMQHALVARGA